MSIFSTPPVPISEALPIYGRKVVRTGGRGRGWREGEGGREGEQLPTLKHVIYCIILYTFKKVA